jgi:catechol 2,3-dioxygenase-like lactoylglutathione lyase family enzyme
MRYENATPGGDDPAIVARAVTVARMAVLRMDHVSVVVTDLEGAIAFFVELGLELEARADVSGPWVDRINAIDGVQVEIAMMRTADGHNKLELTRFEHPSATTAEPNAPANTIGLRSVMFEVDDVDDTVARLRPHGGELVGEIVDYEQIYRLCYLRGPDGIIVSLAEQIR